MVRREVMEGMSKTKTANGKGVYLSPYLYLCEVEMIVSSSRTRLNFHCFVTTNWILQPLEEPAVEPYGDILLIYPAH